MAHEILNPVNALMHAVRLLREPVSETQLADDERQELLAAIERCGGRVMNIVKAVQGFARHEAPTAPLHAVSLSERLDALRPLLRHRLGEVELTYELGFDGPLACYPDLLDQAVMNLLVNAIDAATEVSPADRPRAQPRVVVKSSAHGEEAHLTVSDSGPGVPAAARERIFQPFHTTKAPGKGTGLGLAIAREIAELHGGRLELDLDAPEGGACFRLTLPLRAQAADAPTSNTSAAGSAIPVTANAIVTPLAAKLPDRHDEERSTP